MGVSDYCIDLFRLQWKLSSIYNDYTKNTYGLHFLRSPHLIYLFISTWKKLFENNESEIYLILFH